MTMWQRVFRCRGERPIRTALRSLVLGVLAVGAAACGGDGESGTGRRGDSCTRSADCATDLRCVALKCVPDLPTGFCQKYADLCDARSSRPFDVSACQTGCERSAAMALTDDCWFPACGVEVGMCDNQEPEDAKILQCATNHGWR
jgi:hypothetical protein